MKRTLKQLLALALSGLLFTVGCQKVEDKEPSPNTSRQPVDATAQADMQKQAVAELATLRQPNGKPINAHFMNIINLGIDDENTHQRLLHSLNKEQRQANMAEISALLKLTPTEETRGKIAILMGYTSHQAYKDWVNKTKEEARLLKEEDPGFQELTPSEVNKLIKEILAIHRRNGYHDYMRATGAPRTKPTKVVLHSKGQNSVSGLSTTATYNEPGDDDCGPCYEAFTQCASPCESVRAQTLYGCALAYGEDCEQQADRAYTQCAQGCADAYNECAQNCG